MSRRLIVPGVRARPLMLFILIVPGFLSMLAAIAQSSAEAPADPAFERIWARTDQPVATGQVSRTWMWGPAGFTGRLDEPYAGSPGGQRIVQYFDKARMEITNPDGDDASIWYVTNGLLVVELVTGRIQVGDGSFEERFPAQINVAGDAADPDGPTYATFAGLLDAPALPVGDAITRRVNRDGVVSDDPALATHGVNGAALDDVTGHTIAGPFREFMTSSGTIWDGAGYVEAPLFENAYFATGRPITEAYWATVQLGGSPTDVLTQCFERRCLTYTPENAPGWQVEAGNVGRHYYAWRYEQAGSACPWNEPFPATLDIGDAMAITLHFQVNGCNLSIPQVDMTTDDQQLRSVFFDPPIPAWSPAPAGALSWGWQAGGTFTGHRSRSIPGHILVQRETGSYTATAEAQLIPQPGGSIIQVHGEWLEEGTAEICFDETCHIQPWTNQPARNWSWTLNTATGAVSAGADDAAEEVLTPTTYPLQPTNS